MSSVDVDVRTVAIDAQALVERFKLAMVRPDHAFSPFDGQTRALSVGWVLGEQAIVSLSGCGVKVIDAYSLTCSNDLGWMLLKNANSEGSPLCQARMFGMSGPVQRLLIEKPSTHLQKCVILNRVIGPDIPHELRLNYERDKHGAVIVFDTAKQALESQVGSVYSHLQKYPIIRHCVRLDEGCKLD